MKIKFLLILSLTTTVFAVKNSFTDRPLQISLDGRYISVQFLKRAAKYRVEKRSKCVEVLTEAIDNESKVNVTFSPRDLLIKSCEKN